MLVGACATLQSTAWAASIEFTYFEPDRNRTSPAMRAAWGEDWTWPLKTFPRPQQSTPSALTNVYGLVYWPGETIDVYLRDPDAPIDRVTCTDVISGEQLAVFPTPDAPDHWLIETEPEPAAELPTPPAPTLPAGAEAPSTAEKKAPAQPEPPKEPPGSLQVFRVRAFSGEREVAARGLIIGRPWSGVRAVHGDPYYFRIGVSFGEWSNGSNPWCVMSFLVGYHTFVEDRFPMRNRPWGGTDVFGLKEIHNWPRLAGQVPEQPDYTSQSYADPTLDWNAWWIYYGRGASKWRGEWQWGPFSLMSVEHVSDRQRTYDYGICYGNVKQYSAPYPNGLLFWQWGYYGLNRLAAHMMQVRHAPQFTYDTYDGWEEGLGDEGRSEEVGMMALYYRRCQQLGRDTAWTTNYPSFAAFRDAQWAEYQADRLNDFHLHYRSLDLNRKNYYLYELATDTAYREVTGRDRDYYGGAIGQPGMIDRAAFAGLRQDKRWIGALWNDPFNNGRGGHQGTGNDYSHTGVVNVGSDWFKKTRWYRGYGYNGASLCALWPQMYFGGGHNHEQVMPVRPGASHPGDWKPYDQFLDDGTSYRRMDLFERVPMFYRPGGELTGSELAFCFGGSHAGSDNSSYSEVALWNTQALLGAQVMEFPDRQRPIGGVFVFDSDNQADRQQGRAFLTGKPFSDLIAALHDTLGIVTYANPDTERDIPPDIPVVYAPRQTPDGPAVLAARVGDQTLSVPYDGPAMQLPSSPQFQQFVRRVREAAPEGWPLSTTGGFAAGAWESSHGVFVAVENPMDSAGVIHTPRQGSVTVRVRGLTGKPAVIDLCGDDPDPHRLDDRAVTAHGEFVTFQLDWPRGDARLFWIPPPSLASRR